MNTPHCAGRWPTARGSSAPYPPHVFRGASTRLLLLLGIMAALLPPARLDTQEPLPCGAGDRVRVSAPMLRDHTVPVNLSTVIVHGYARLAQDRARGRLVATAVHVTPESLTVEPVRTHARVAVPWDSVLVLERSLGHMPRGTFVARSALILGAANAAVWTTVYLLVADDDCSTGGDILCFERRDWPVVAGFTGGIGAAAGAFTGMILPRPERWQRVPLPAGIVAGASTDGRVAVGLSRHF